MLPATSSHKRVRDDDIDPSPVSHEDTRNKRPIIFPCDNTIYNIPFISLRYHPEEEIHRLAKCILHPRVVSMSIMRQLLENPKAEKLPAIVFEHLF